MGIKWVVPQFEEEVGEYFENSLTKSFFKRRGLEFQTEQEFLTFLESGSLVPLDLNQLSGVNTENFTLEDVDFEEGLADPEYKQSYDSMEQALLGGLVVLPAPIVVRFPGVLFLLAGNRRVNLARRHGLPLQVWMVDASAFTVAKSYLGMRRR